MSLFGILGITRTLIDRGIYGLRVLAFLDLESTASRSEGAVLKRLRFSNEQIVWILQVADKVPVTEVAKRCGVSELSICAWRNKFGDLGTDDYNSPDSRTRTMPCPDIFGPR